MASIEIEQLLSEVSPDSPAGEDLEYDPAFVELQRIAAKKSESAIEGPGEEVEQIDWKGVVRGSSELLTRTKDLRLAVLFTQSMLNTEGFPGLALGLTLIQQLLERFWDTLYPLLDHEDGDDPTMRINVIASLCDRESMLQTVSIAPLVSIKGWGSYSYQDIRGANRAPPNAGDGEEEGGTEEAQAGQVRAAFLECPIEDLKATSDSLSQSQSTLAAIDQFLLEKVGSSHAPDFSELIGRLKEVVAIVSEFLQLRGESTPDAPEVESGNTGGQAMQALAGEINSRESAMKMMDKISDYFRRTEPSSPVPLLMQRAKRLSTMGFMEIVKDIAPDGLQQVQNISGMDSE